MAITSAYTKTYTSFSGCDIVCTFGTTVIGSLTAITYSVQREKVPIFTFGSANPRSFSRGKRGIGGSLVFSVFDRDALLAAINQNDNIDMSSFQRIGGDLNMKPLTIDNWDKQMTDIAQASEQTSSTENATSITQNVAIKARPYYDDEVPPFDITISFANEYGQKAVTQIYACEILNEANGFSMDSIQSQKACTFVARSVQYMRPVDA